MEKFDCDARCLNAKGLACTCWCGGVNHGRDAYPHPATLRGVGTLPAKNVKVKVEAA